MAPSCEQNTLVFGQNSGMKHLVGMDDYQWREQNTSTPVVLDTDNLINGHMLYAGMSGTGKSYQLMQLINTAALQGIEVDVFDVHEELHVAKNSAAVKFSEATRAGYNPLVIHLDQHSGGVRKQVASIIDMINRTSQQLGPRQESALRNLLNDVYRLRGCMADSPNTWRRDEVTERQYDEMIDARDYRGLRNYYPILRDVIDYTRRQLKIMSTGGDVKAVNALEKVERSAARLHSLTTKHGKAATDEEVQKIETQLADERQKAIEAYMAFVHSVETGREYQDITKYTNRDTLQSVLERLEGLQEAGIFCSNPPQWHGKPVRIYQVGALSDDERRLLFYTRAQQILRECMDAGLTDSVRRILLVDEGHLYYSEDSDNPLNRIAKEGRKFGLGLVIGSQSPTHFSEDFITNCGTIFLMGIHEKFWDGTVRQLKIEQAVLKSTRPREVLSVRMQRKGEPSSRFITVNVDQKVIDSGLQAWRAKRAA